MASVPDLSAATSPHAHRGRRWPRRLALALLLVYVAYLLLGNLFLNTALGPWSINRKPEKFRMDWVRR